MEILAGEERWTESIEHAVRGMRIVFVVTALAVGGAEIQVVELARELHRRGWAASIVTMIAPVAFTPELAADGIPVISLDMRRGVPDPRAVWRLAALVRKTRPLILHSHMVHANLLARVTRLVCPVPVVISTIHTAYESSDTTHGDAVREFLYRVTDPLAERTTAVCFSAARHYLAARAVHAEKLTVIPNGVDTRRFLPDEAARERTRSELSLGGEFIWLAVGRLTPVKDYSGMIEAFGIVHGRHPDARLLIAGDGELHAQLDAEIAARGLAGPVRLLGIRPDTPALMNAADAYVLSSQHEGLPLVLLEASATGLPIVATGAGGSKEIVVANETGLLVDPGNPEGLARAMEAIVSLDPEQRGAMGRKARERAEKYYDLSKVAYQWEQLYLKEIVAYAGGDC